MTGWAELKEQDSNLENMQPAQFPDLNCIGTNWTEELTQVPNISETLAGNIKYTFWKRFLLCSSVLKRGCCHQCISTNLLILFYVIWDCKKALYFSIKIWKHFDRQCINKWNFLIQDFAQLHLHASTCCKSFMYVSLSSLCEECYDPTCLLWFIVVCRLPSQQPRCQNRVVLGLSFSVVCPIPSFAIVVYSFWNLCPVFWPQWQPNFNKMTSHLNGENSLRWLIQTKISLQQNQLNIKFPSPQNPWN